MKVKKIMALAADLVGRWDLSDYLEGKGGADEAGLRRDAEQMLRCFNMTENEAALDYIPLRAERTLFSEGLVPFAALDPAPAEILSVCSADGVRLPFVLTAEGIRVRRGETVIRYRFRPAVKAPSDDADFSAGERFLALGTACEFALMEGMLDRAAELDVRYKDALAAAGRCKNVRVKGRNWV